MKTTFIKISFIFFKIFLFLEKILKSTFYIKGGIKKNNGPTFVACKRRDGTNGYHVTCLGVRTLQRYRE